jgi:thioredoxin-like negative regulator of GroEL
MRAQAKTVLVLLMLAILAYGAARLICWRHERQVIRNALAACQDVPSGKNLRIVYPFNEALFPPEIVAPTFRWEDKSGCADRWLVEVRFPDRNERWDCVVREKQWMPGEAQWEKIKGRSVEKPVCVTIAGINPSVPEPVLSLDRVSIRTSRDEVGAPIFYREVILPFEEAVKDPSRLRWRFGSISSQKIPPVVLEKLPVCGNCHSFSADGRTLGMDVDYANDKGSYAIAPIEKEITLATGKIITWSDYRREDQTPTFGLLSQVSPDGRYIVSTVKDRSVFVALPELTYSQLFFPLKGILVVYDRRTRIFSSLPGADDPQYVQSNAVWSPDGKTLVFARNKAYSLQALTDPGSVFLSREKCRQFIEGGEKFPYDLYQIPFNDGKGGRAEPLAGASRNGMSNYFPKFSPDGKWIVFCRARSFMLLQRDSELWIVPAAGGTARRMQCNLGRMNSWHSWSPNGRWLVFSSKELSNYTQLFLTHIDEAGNSSPPVLLERFTEPDRAANIPEFVNNQPTAIRRIHEQFVDDNSYYRAGHQFLDSGDMDKALESFQKAAKLNPHNIDALNRAGSLLENKLARQFLAGGKLEESERHFAAAVRYDSENTDARINLAKLLMKRKQYSEAVPHYLIALNSSPENVELLTDLESCYVEMGDVPRALLVAGRHLEIVRRKGNETEIREAQRRIEIYRKVLAAAGHPAPRK